MDKHAICHLLQSNPNSFTFADPQTNSRYLKTYQVIYHDGEKTDYLQCKICKRILTNNPLSRASISYHYFIHQCPSMNSAYHSNKQTQKFPSSSNKNKQNHKTITRRRRKGCHRKKESETDTEMSQSSDEEDEPLSKSYRYRIKSRHVTDETGSENEDEDR